jgi:hypothetical protein
MKRKIENLTRALADGYSPAIRADLARLEEQLANTTTGSAAIPGPREKMRETHAFVESRLNDLRTLFSAEAVTIRAEVSKHVREITLTPEGSAYIASGAWDLLGAWQHGWCRGPESNWLRPPFQGGALPLSYPGTACIPAQNSFRAK